MAYAIMAILDGYATVEESRAEPIRPAAREAPELGPESMLEEHTWTEPARGDLPPPAYTPVTPRPARKGDRS